MKLSIFFDAIRPMFPGSQLFTSQVQGIEHLLKKMDGMYITHVAYLLATAKIETDATMQPIAEYGKGRGKQYGKPGRNGGQVPYGRGYTQITWDDNYDKADKKLGLKGRLRRDYDLALDPDIAADIMIRGATEGWFTTHKLSDYLPVGGAPDYVGARRVINGQDRAKEVARDAKAFERALRAAGMSVNPPAPTVAPPPKFAAIAAIIAAIFGALKWKN